MPSLSLVTSKSDQPLIGRETKSYSGPEPTASATTVEPSKLRRWLEKYGVLIPSAEVKAINLWQFLKSISSSTSEVSALLISISLAYIPLTMLFQYQSNPHSDKLKQLEKKRKTCDEIQTSVTKELFESEQYIQQLDNSLNNMAPAEIVKLKSAIKTFLEEQSKLNLLDFSSSEYEKWMRIGRAIFSGINGASAGRSFAIACKLSGASALTFILPLGLMMGTVQYLNDEESYLRSYSTKLLLNLVKSKTESMEELGSELDNRCGSLCGVLEKLCKTQDKQERALSSFELAIAVQDSKHPSSHVNNEEKQKGVGRNTQDDRINCSLSRILIGSMEPIILISSVLWVFSGADPIATTLGAIGLILCILLLIRAARELHTSHQDLSKAAIAVGNYTPLFTDLAQRQNKCIASLSDLVKELPDAEEQKKPSGGKPPATTFEEFLWKKVISYMHLNLRDDIARRACKKIVENLNSETTSLINNFNKIAKEERMPLLDDFVKRLIANNNLMDILNKKIAKFDRKHLQGLHASPSLHVQPARVQDNRFVAI